MNKDLLRQYLYYQQEIEQLETEKRLIYHHLCQCPAPQNSPYIIGNTPDWVDKTYVDKAYFKLAALQEKIDRRIDRSIMLRMRIEEAIACLDVQERVLLRKRYVEGKTWDKIASEMNYSESHIRRLGGQAVVKLERL